MHYFILLNNPYYGREAPTCSVGGRGNLEKVRLDKTKAVALQDPDRGGRAGGSKAEYGRE